MLNNLSLANYEFGDTASTSIIVEFIHNDEALHSHLGEGTSYTAYIPSIGKPNIPSLVMSSQSVQDDVCG